MKPSHITGSILGTAIGDSIGLPYEGLSRHRASKLLGFPNQHRLLFGFGMISDDTEHTCIVAQSLIASGGNLAEFQNQLARRLRWWLLGFPAGVGLATLRSILKLWFGVSPNKSGVFSAGNGPAMRSAILGVAISDLDRLREAVRIASRITHTDPKAEYGAFAIALAARNACQTIVSGDDFMAQLNSCLDSDANQLISLISQAVDSVKKAESTPQFAAGLGLSGGVSGYVYHSVAVAIHAWLSHQHDYQGAIIAAVQCGGDTDSIAAMVGGIVGASVGKEGIPTEWLHRLLEPSRSIKWMECLAKQLGASIQTGTANQPIQLSVPGLLLRNVLFLLVVLSHGFRRLLPPY
ncbi:ADP-ribosylglycohydrolase family protein [Pseudanabaena sp. PCC 6802]|uniref:ADP-ribosylglycohydrolase family protein n=1 Tax=Pseudanabaena sp. PCC 6802 TaxID=118173 RepID=UPI00034D1877|nr:ADP-ribosylglycohydrolase family protein [Pseudanabaena sp. PCC 6802]